MGELSVVGKPVPRIDGVEKVTGSAKYVVDMTLPRMLHAKILRSPHAHAKIVSIDTSEAERLPGVKGVITGKNVREQTQPYGCLIKDEMALHADKVRYAGDEVAAVAAESEEIADEALALIKVEYEPLPAVLDVEESMKPDATVIHENVAGAAGNVLMTNRVKVGDIEQGFKDADFTFRDRFYTSKQHAAPPEPHASLAHFDRLTGKLTLWSSTQSIFLTRLEGAASLGLPETKMRVIAPSVGGGFGHKVDGVYSTDICAALLSKKTGRPVKIVLTREEETSATRTRHPTVREIEVGVKKDGTIVAWREKDILDTGAYASFGPGVMYCTTITTPGPYKISNLLLEGYTVYTNKVPSGAYRGFGNAQSTFGRESILDTIAEALGIDPLELRMRNIIRPEELPYTTSTRHRIRSCGMKDCLEKASGKIGWSEKKQSKTPNRGVGVAAMMHWSSCRWWPDLDADFSSAYVRLNEDGTATLFTGMGDAGQGIYTSLVQVAAEELGLLPEDFTVVSGDSETTPGCLGMWGSRAAVVAGSAVKIAAVDARQRLLEVAAAMLEASPEDLELRDRKVYVKGSPDRARSIADVTATAYFTREGGSAGPILGKGFFDSPTEILDEQGGDYCPTYAFAAHTAEVEVDPETGKVELLRLVAAHDCGLALNPSIVEGQIQGGASHGIGYGMYEDLICDQKTGQVLNPSFLDYRLPTALDLPNIDTVLVQDAIDPAIPSGAKGVGETGLVCPAAAIGNAIYDAVGVRIKDLPITPEKVLAALKTKKVSV